MDTIVKLYACYDCSKQVFHDDMKKGQNCKCGSNKFRLHQPTFFWRWHYLLHYYGLFGAIKEWMASTVVPAVDPPGVVEAMQRKGLL